MDVSETDPYYAALVQATQNGELIDFGEVISLLREEVSGWTQERFAKAFGLPLSTLVSIESGSAPLSVDHLNAILMMFGLQVGIAPYRLHEFAVPDQIKVRRDKVFVMAEMPR